MEIKKIVEGMTAPQVAQVIDENFNALNGEKATVEAVADVQKNVNRSDDNTGVLSYPEYSSTEPVAVGDVRRYEGLLYRAKEAGAYDWDPEKWERVTLKQLEDEKLSELGSEVHNNYFIGSGNKFTSTKINGLVPNHKYKIYLHKLWDASSIQGITQSSYQFLVASYKDNTEKRIIGSYYGENIKSEYEFTLPSEFDYVSVGGRAVNGELVRFTFEDITECENLSAEIYEKIKNTSSELEGDIKNASSRLVIKGMNSVYAENTEYNLLKNRKYKIELINNTWDSEGLTENGYRLVIYYTANGITNDIYRSYTSTNLPTEYYFNTSSDFESLTIGIRAKEGYRVVFNIIDITEFEKIRNEIKLGDNETYSNIMNGRGSNYEINKLIGTQGEVFTRANWYYTKDYIEVKSGDSLLWRIGDEQYGGAALVIYDENKEYLSYFGANTTPDRTVAIPNGAKYIRVSAFHLYNGEINKYPISINGVDYEIKDKVKSINELIEENNEEIRKEIGESSDEAISAILYGREGNISENECLSYTGAVATRKNWYYTKDYIEVKPGDSLFWRIGDEHSPVANIVVYDENKEYLSYFGANTTPDRTVAIPNNAKYIRVSAFHLYNGKYNKYPISINGVDYGIIKPIESIYPKDTEHGKIGELFPEEMNDIFNLLEYSGNGFGQRFHFIHISDNHGASFGYSNEFLDLSPAKFLINTGDMLIDKFSDFPQSRTVEFATSTEKPCYLVLGNHDYSHATSKQDVFDAFMKPTHQHNGVNSDKSYYSVDYTDYGVKCIMLDMNDGWSDSELQQLGPTPLTRGKMSSGQINWLISQLEDAATNNLHVCLFIHIVPCQIDANRVIDNFSDYHSLGSVIASNLTFLADIVDAWIEGRNISFSYDGVIYEHTFTIKGHFVSWFFGHLHYDECGWMKDHPNQFMVGICKPFHSGAKGFGTYDVGSDDIGAHFNYYTIDTFMNSLAVYRVGHQSTVYATERKSFRVIYK